MNMTFRISATTCLAVLALSLGTATTFAQDATTGGTGNTGNQDNAPAAIQQDTTGTITGNATTGGTGNTGNQTNNPAAIQENGGSPCPSGTVSVKNAAGQLVCQ
jgi:hypothetical protein